MKFNLKILRQICEDEQAGAVVYDVLDAFEKELRELQKKFRKEIYDDENYDGTTAITIEEILGDSE